MIIRLGEMSKQAQKERLTKPGVHMLDIGLLVLTLETQQTRGVRSKFGFRKLIGIDCGFRLQEKLHTSLLGTLLADIPDFLPVRWFETVPKPWNFLIAVDDFRLIGRAYRRDRPWN